MKKVRKHYDEVIGLLYSALYGDYELSDRDLKLIIEYIMNEYLKGV